MRYPRKWFVRQHEWNLLFREWVEAKYIDYYSHLMRVKGVLAGVKRACAFATKVDPGVKKL